MTLALTIAAALFVGFLVAKGTGRVTKGIIAAPIAWGFLLVVPVLALMVASYVMGHARDALLAWSGEAIAVTSIAVVLWLVWQVLTDRA